MMKKLKKMSVCIALFLMMASFVAPIYARDGDYNLDIYHFNCPENLVDEDEYIAENELVDSTSKFIEFDIVTFMVPDLKFKDFGFYEYLEAIYEKNELGYGINNDGIILGVDTTNNRFLIVPMGRGKEIYNEANTKALADSVKTGFEENSYIGAQQAYREKVQDVVSFDTRSDSKENYRSGYKMEVTSLSSNETYESTPVESAPAIEKPDWYVEDPNSFVDFHNDASVSRVVDNADIFTDEEEKEIKARIKQIAKNENEDVVIYTDVTSYGMDAAQFAMDFYVYNGYGFNDTYDGMVLFVNMDPNAREMCTSGFGKAQEAHNTQAMADALDDILFDHFKQQAYGQGVLSWLDAVEELFHYGTVNAPAWYKNYVDGNTTKDSNNSKLVDDLNYFDESQKKEIESQLVQLKEKYGYDFVIYVAKEEIELSNMGDFIDAFVEVNGYDQDAVVLVLYESVTTKPNPVIRTYGEAEKKFDKSILSRILGFMNDEFFFRHYDTTIDIYLKYINTYLETGRIPHSWFTRMIWFFSCLLAGLIAGGGSLAGAKAKMKTVKKATGARNEMVEGSFRVNRTNDVYLTTTVTKTYSPEQKSSGRSGGGSSGRSSFSSSARSSSGRSGSSSRRSF